MPSAHSLLVRFWGVRGSTPCPGPKTVRYGGNTACVEIRFGSSLLIFDAGTGLRALGQHLMQESRPLDADLFFSHLHLDHVIGLPFFAPLFVEGQSLTLWAGNLLPALRLEETVRRMMSPPLFPVEVEVWRAAIAYRDFCSGDMLSPRPGITLRTAPLDHPDGATGYRLECAGKVVAYLTDTETRPGGREAEIIALARGADLMIFDCTYTEDEIAAHAGWGHSTWRDAVRLANAAGAKTLCLFHHDPDHDDDFMDALAVHAEAARPGTIVAREGLTLKF
jgi:phosphoribosyl 1,2-cyclic phosphodiesterase